MLWCAACEKVLAAFGAAVLLYFAAKVLGWFYTNFLMSTNLLSKYKKAGNWAVVTGASDGIGKAMAVDLAKRGFNVAIIARTKSKLDETAELITKRNVEAKVITFDFLNGGDAEFAQLFKQLDELAIGVLVNNVGINYEGPEFYEDTPIEKDLGLVKVNIESQLRMCKYVVPKMKAKRSGGIVNLSSVSCRMPTPLLSTYAASKSFNRLFSDSLRGEVKSFGIDVLTVTPSFVCSLMSGRKRATFDCPSAPQMAYQTLNKLPTNTTTHGHRHHEIIFSIFERLPTSFRDNFVLSANKTTRAKLAKKKAREASVGATTTK